MQVYLGVAWDGLRKDRPYVLMLDEDQPSRLLGELMCWFDKGYGCTDLGFSRVSGVVPGKDEDDPYRYAHVEFYSTLEVLSATLTYLSFLRATPAAGTTATPPAP